MNAVVMCNVRILYIIIGIPYFVYLQVAIIVARIGNLKIGVSLWR